MRTYPSREFTLPTVYLVVTVAMDCCQIDVLIVMTVSIEMMEINKCIGHEEKSTFLALAFLLFEHCGQASWDTRIGPATTCPVTPVVSVHGG
jgi:hypothetical protein